MTIDDPHHYTMIVLSTRSCRPLDSWVDVWVATDFSTCLVDVLNQLHFKYDTLAKPVDRISTSRIAVQQWILMTKQIPLRVGIIFTKKPWLLNVSWVRCLDQLKYCDVFKCSVWDGWQRYFTYLVSLIYYRCLDIKVRFFDFFSCLRSLMLKLFGGKSSLGSIRKQVSIV